MIFIFLLLLNLLLFSKLSKISEILNIYDIPDGKLKLHKKKTPIIGGTILAINFLMIFFYQIFFLNDFLSIEINNLNNLELFSLFLLIYAYFFLGLYDDKYQLAPLKRIVFSIMIILVSVLLNDKLIISDFILSFYGKRIFFNNLSIVFTIFCILILINSLNFYDGINGQSCLIFIAFFTYLLFKSDFNFFYLICIILISIVLLLNLKNMIFLGDSGVYLLSIILSISIIYEHNIQENILYADEIFFLLLFPGFDLLRLTITRSLNSKNPFLGDRKHIHHLLINKFSLMFSNTTLLFMSMLPIVLFLFLKVNSFLIFLIFLLIYFFLIQYLKSGVRS